MLQRLTGSGIGDVRSRLVRLVPENGDAETIAIKHFLHHRLPKDEPSAKTEWLSIIEGTHALWSDISTPKRELLRSFLNSFNLEAVKRIRPTSRFDFSGASIGNLFLTGARLFTGSFEAAIYLLSSICSVPDRIGVLPALNTNFTHHVAVGLENGTVIIGQNNISHPSEPVAAFAEDADCPTRSRWETEEHDKVEDANLPGTLSTLRKAAIEFSKEEEEDLPARIERLWYINPYGQEIRISANPRVVEALTSCTTVIYSIGSLFTSLIPNLVLGGVGKAISSTLTIRNKILILNGTTDRESGPPNNPLTAMDFVRCIANACADSQGMDLPLSERDYGRYVTHVIYLEGAGAPKVEREKFSEAGIEAVRVYGRGGGRYDESALRQALEAIAGRPEGRPGEKRRNTLLG